jgi:hypothetical protein
MSDGQKLKEILIHELESIPPYFWGGFFPIHIAIWRFLLEKYSGYFGKVQAIKDSSLSGIPSRLVIDDLTYSLTKYPSDIPDDFETSGYGLSGDRIDILNQILWESEEIFQRVERLGYFLAKSISDIVDANDRLKYIPILDDDLLSELASLCIAQCDRLINNSNWPKQLSINPSGTLRVGVACAYAYAIRNSQLKFSSIDR